MKKVFSMLLAVMCVVCVQAKTIYLDAGGDQLWDQGGAVFFAHSWGSSGYEDHKMGLLVPGVYTAEIPDAFTSISFIRMPYGSTALDWDSKWNRTDDLTIPSGKDCYTITGWGSGEGANSTGTWSKYSGSTTMSYYLAGSGFPGVSWDAGKHLAMTDGKIEFTDLAAGTYKFKVTNNTWQYALGASAVDASCSSSGYGDDTDGNVVIVLASTGSIAIEVKSGKLCVTIVGETKDVYGTAVRSQCGDVLLQGFFFDSYEVDSAHAGTLEYGDTKWTTLRRQADEIGAYFDLVWLPPSSYAAGTGYHPKQYNNQNSDWGSRSQLEELIGAFHNNGTKVVADIVINHAEGLTSWCDMAVEDFGEYGRFEPGPSFITSTDEVNELKNKADTLAGECYGYSKNSRADDGENWADARDWAHDNPEVQEMFKAYMKWLRNVIGYDGWRYDKGDGFNNWHMDNYNKASEPYIAFMECWTNVDDVKRRIGDANKNVMGLDFWTRYDMIDPMAGWDYKGRQGGALMSDDNWKKYAVTFVDNHDMSLRGEGKEFAGDGNSLSPALKYRLLGANAFLLSMPGVPCIFYPHWAKYKEEIKDMIVARHMAGVHSESEVKDVYHDMDGERHSGYQATIVGKNGHLILCLGTKANKAGFGSTYKLIASGYHTYNDNGKSINESYEMWVESKNDVAPHIIATQSSSFEDLEKGIDVTIQAVGGSGTATIYYTTDGSVPTTSSSVYTAPLNFKETTTLNVMAVCGSAQSKVQTYTYTYREPLARGIRVHFAKPAEWDKVYIFAWIPGVDEKGNATSSNLLGAFPGQRIYQDAEGWYSYEFDASLDSVDFQINSGDDCGGINVKSNDLKIDYDACYGWREGKETENKEEIVLDCETTKLDPSFDLVIAPESGYFRDKTEGQDVTISVVGKPNAMIYYSLDGSDPKSSSLTEKEQVSFKVTETTTVRAIAFSAEDKEWSPEYSATYTYKAPQQGAITVKFIKPEEWETLYLYAFTRVKKGSRNIDTPYALDGNVAYKKWPGMPWNTKDGEWYTYTLPEEIKDIYVIFTEGDKKPQTQDIYVTEDVCYIWSEDCHRGVYDEDCDGKAEDPRGIEIVVDQSSNNHETYKLIHEDHIVIIRSGIMYDVLGRRL